MPSNNRKWSKRTFLKTSGSLAVLSSFAGCSGGEDSGSGGTSDDEPGSGNNPEADSGAKTTQKLPTFENKAGVEVGETYEAVEALAKDEEKATLYATIDREDMRLLFEKFGEAYPDIDVEHITGGSEDLLSRWSSEYNTGNVEADLSISNRNATIIAEDQNQELSKSFMPSLGKLSDQFKDSDNGDWVGVRMRLGNVFYNTDMVSESDASTWMDIVTDDQWSGKKLGWDPTPNMDLMWWLLDTQGREFFENLREQEPRFVDSHSDLARFTGAGEFPVAFTYTHKMGSMGNELPIDYFKFDPTPGVIDAMVMNNKAPNPNSAIVFMNWLTSKEGQNVMGQTQYIPAHPGAEYKGYPNVYPSDEYEVDTYISKPENRKKANEMWQDVMGDLIGSQS